ncbi:MAG: BatA domain-containing protein [Phycisphaerae bacterium]|jgi:hypothetical protein
MSAFPPLLAFGFVHPALLGGLGLAVAPIIIHWLSRRRARHRPWAAMTWLLEAERQTRRRVLLEQWLLVALRCLALALLALLIARPFLRPGVVASLVGAGGQVTRVVILDNSASLAFRSGAEVELTRLQTAADRLLTWFHDQAPQDHVVVCLTSGGGEMLFDGTLGSDAALSDVRTRLRNCAPTSTPARPRRVLTSVADHLREGGVTRADVYVFSDLQRTDWTPAGQSVFEPLRELAQAGAAEGAATPATQIRCVLVASGGPRRDNVALTDLRLERAQTIAGIPAVVRAQVANYGVRPVRDLVVQVDLDGTPLPAVPAEPIDAGALADVLFEVTFPDEGYHQLTLTVGPVDSFRLDDVRRLAVFVKPSLPVLVVDGAPAADPHNDEVFLLRTALAPSGPLSSGLRVDVVDPDELAAAELESYDAVLLCNLAPPGAGLIGQLQRYVRRGGGLAFFLGSEVGDASAYNRAFYADGTGLLPLPLERLGSPTGQAAGVGLIRATPHPVTTAFPASADTLSEYVHFWRYFRCRTDAESLERDPAPAILAHYTDDEQTPALIERPHGRGRVLLFTSSVDLDWNDWARSPDGSYVVTLLETVQYIARRHNHPGSLAAGEVLAVPVEPDVYEPSALYKPPAYPDEPAVPSAPPQRGPAGEDIVVLPGPEAQRLGTYMVELTTRSGRLETRPLCVNLALAESDLAAAAPADLDAALAGLPYELFAAATDFLRGAAQTRRELWPLALLSVVLVLTLEQTLAWYFGKAGR